MAKLGKVDKEISVVNGTIKIWTFDRATVEGGDHWADQIAFDVNGSHSERWVCTNLTLDNAKELVATLIDAIEDVQGEPF